MKKKISILSWIIACCSIVSWGQGEVLQSINYTVKDGLPSNEVYWMMQAKNGLVWIGCDAGLVNFDGVNFKTYTAPNTRNKAISGIYEDSLGRLWCHNFGGQIYYLEQDSLHLLEAWENYSENEGLGRMRLEGNWLNLQNFSSNWSYNIKTAEIRKKKGAGILLKDGSSIVFNERTGFLKEQDGRSTKLSCPACFYLDVYSNKGARKRFKRGEFLVASSLKLYYIHDYLRKEWKNLNGNISQEDQKIPFVFSLEQDSLQAIYFPPILERYKTNLIVNKVKVLYDSVLALCTSEGFFLWNIKSDQVQHFFKDEILSDCFLDQEENLWVSSLEKGLFFVPVLSLMVHDLGAKSKRIYHIEKDKRNHILLGYDDGSIEYWDIKAQKKLFEKTFPIRKRIQHITYNELKDEFWIATMNKTYVFYPTQQKMVKTHIGGAIKELRFDVYGNILLALGHGATINTPNSKKRIVLPNSWEQSNYWEGYQRQLRLNEKGYLILCGEEQRSYSILAQAYPQYTIWVGAMENLKYYTAGKEYDFKTASNQSIIAKCLELVNDSTLAVGSLKKGLYLIQNKKIIKQLTLEDGLPSNEIQQIKVRDGVLWAITASGIATYNWSADSLSIWDKNKGLFSRNILDLLFLENEVYLTNGENLMSIPIDFESKKERPIIDITQITINDSIYALNSLNALSYSENNIKIKFRGIAYKSQKRFQYKYRLNDIEKEWNYVSSANNIVSYPNLSAGNYTFEVVAVTPSGVQSKPAKIGFKIEKPFYETWWFLLGLLILFIVFVGWQYRWQIKKIQQKNEEKLQRSRLERDIRISELKALKSQLNPHFIFNALNSIQDYIIQNERELASDYLGMFADLMRTYLQHSQEGTLSLREEIDALRLYLELEAVRLEDNFSYDIIIGEQIDRDQIIIPTMLIQPYVENAIKHGLFRKKGNKHVAIEFKLHSPMALLATIRDNGIGRKAAQNYGQPQNHKSFATSANNSRLELLNYEQSTTIEAKIIDLVENGESVGTEVHVIIPIEKEF
ncbi:sensor histidine kinase [Aureispira anguillae]|uniref:Histidine kinase n=1 Tax=Aureispira anguillae TaxID=2864201 RepID=A0A916DR09_9BACT|nr:histidine kinase [Aureispira anguillae]BDS11016.1 histidine kinase [Aureispira anguillae]